jgi:hypothetical protein
MFWGPAGTYCLSMAIAEFISLKSGDFNAFFSQKSFAWVTLEICPKIKEATHQI